MKKAKQVKVISAPFIGFSKRNKVAGGNNKVGGAVLVHNQSGQV